MCLTEGVGYCFGGKNIPNLLGYVGTMSCGVFCGHWGVLSSVSLRDRCYCSEGVISSKCPMKIAFTVQEVSSHYSTKDCIITTC